MLIKISLYHPETELYFDSPIFDTEESGDYKHGVLALWDMREALSKAIPLIATYLSIPHVAVMAEHNIFEIVVREA